MLTIYIHVLTSCMCICDLTLEQLLQELTLHDIDLLLKAYRRAAQLKQKEFLEQVYSGTLDIASTDLVGRFSHYTYGSLRLADAKLLLEDFQQKLI